MYVYTNKKAPEKELLPLPELYHSKSALSESENHIPLTGLSAGAASRTFVIINMRAEIVYPDRPVRTDFLTFFAADTPCLAG